MTDVSLLLKTGEWVEIERFKGITEGEIADTDVFFSKGTRCFKCHQKGAAGSSTLSKIAWHRLSESFCVFAAFD